MINKKEAAEVAGWLRESQELRYRAAAAMQAWYDKGASQQEIAEAVHTSNQNVSNLLAAFRKSLSADDFPKYLSETENPRPRTGGRPPNSQSTGKTEQSPASQPIPSGVHPLELHPAVPESLIRQENGEPEISSVVNTATLAEDREEDDEVENKPLTMTERPDSGNGGSHYQPSRTGKPVNPVSGKTNPYVQRPPLPEWANRIYDGLNSWVCHPELTRRQGQIMSKFLEQKLAELKNREYIK